MIASTASPISILTQLIKKMFCVENTLIKVAPVILVLVIQAPVSTIQLQVGVDTFII